MQLYTTAGLVLFVSRTLTSWIFSGTCNINLIYIIVYLPSVKLQFRWSCLIELEQPPDFFSVHCVDSTLNESHDRGTDISV